MEYINYLTNCPCCGKEQVIASRTPMEVRELQRLSLAICTCPASSAHHDAMWAEFLKELGYTELHKDAMKAVGLSEKDVLAHDA